MKRRASVYPRRPSKIRNTLAVLSALVLSACSSYGAMARKDAGSASPENRFAAREEDASGVADGIVGGRPGDKPDKTASRHSGGDTRETERKLIHSASLVLLVNALEEATESATAVAKKNGGFVESTRQPNTTVARLVLRVRADRFRQAIDELSALGRVHTRQIQSQDVSKEYTDVQSRIELARITRQRLFDVLAHVKDVKERAKILREINRLTTEIDTAEAQIAFLNSRVNMSTIEVTLQAERRGQVRTSPPFPWVAILSADRRTIQNTGQLAAVMPQGFFDNSTNYYGYLFGAIGGQGQYLYSSPEGTVIRLGSVRNEVKADATFWKLILSREMQYRGFITKSTDEVAGWTRYRFELPEANRRIYEICIRITNEWIHVIEVTYNDAAVAQEQEGELKRWIASVKER